MIQIFYFSPTGNVQYLAETLSKRLGENTTLFPIEFSNPLEIQPSRKIVILFPVHAFNAPRTVKRFIKGFPHGLCEEISLISVGCNDTWINSAASLTTRKMLESKGYSIQVDTVLAMPLTMVAEFPEELKEKMISDAKKRIDTIASDICSSNVSERTIPLKSKLLRIIGSSEDFAARLFGLELYASKKCTSCKICVDRCPEQNIVFDKNNKPKFTFNCLMCMRCIYECPEQAIKPRFSRFIPLKNGYSIQNNKS